MLALALAARWHSGRVEITRHFVACFLSTARNVSTGASFRACSMRYPQRRAQGAGTTYLDHRRLT